MQQDEEGPSPFRDLYQPGEEGLHHAAMMVDSLPETYRYCRENNLEIAARAETLTGTEFAFVDTVSTLGHMIEVYEKSDELVRFLRFRQHRFHWLGWKRASSTVTLARPIRE